MSHLRPTAPIAEGVVLTEDPALAMALAQELTDEPRMSNHAHGLWGYTGRTPAGLGLTVQSSGIGGPSLAVVVEDLRTHGASRIIRVGACQALDPSLRLGDALLVTQALAHDGTSRALGQGDVTHPDPGLEHALREHSAGWARTGTVVSMDLLQASARADAADLATAALFAIGSARSLTVAALLVVASAGGEELGDEELQASALRLGRAADAALEGAQRAQRAP